MITAQPDCTKSIVYVAIVDYHQSLWPQLTCFCRPEAQTITAQPDCAFYSLGSNYRLPSMVIASIVNRFADQRRR